jgi:hypothetical protein
MMLLIILLFLLIGLNMVLIFVLVRKYDEAKLNIVIVKGSGMTRIEHFELYKSNPLMY